MPNKIYAREAMAMGLSFKGLFKKKGQESDKSPLPGSTAESSKTKPQTDKPKKGPQKVDSYDDFFGDRTG
jgi:hypothetical protein